MINKLEYLATEEERAAAVADIARAASFKLPNSAPSTGTNFEHNVPKKSMSLNQSYFVIYI